MKVLLDTNVWRYLVDSGRQSFLNSEAKRGGFQVTICPAIVNETLRISDATLRKKIVELQTRRCWHRLMPESYLALETMKLEMLRTHSDWPLSNPDERKFRKLAFNWARSTGGWWSYVRENVDICAAKMRPRDDLIINTVRDQSHQMRTSVRESKKSMVGDWLPSLRGAIDINGETTHFDGWRIYAFTTWANMLHGDATAREWMGCHMDIDKMIYEDFSKFERFWLYEVSAEAVPREWLRAAIFAMQADRKVTDGNPLDATIGVHLVDVDLVISADRNFVAMIKRCHNEAPFVTANAFCISGGDAGIDQLFELFAKGVTTRVPH